MNRIVRRRLEMAKRVRDFNRAHLSTDAAYSPVLALLEELIGRMQAAAKQQRGGLLTTHASVVRRRALRRRLHHELLRHLVTVAGAGGAVPLPAGQRNLRGVPDLRREMLEQGQAQRELLLEHGLAERLLDDLAAAVDDFDASVVESNEGRRDHVGARAELKAVSDEVMQLVELLDGLNRYRFGGNAELRAAWESTRKVVVGPRSAEQLPVAEEVKPAA